MNTNRNTVRPARLARLALWGALALSLALPPSRAADAASSGLAGSWLYGSLGTVQYHNPLTNEWRNGRGASELLKINADGTYERSRFLTLTTYNCTSKLFITEKGTVKIEGDQLTYRPREGVNQGYTCTPSNGWRTTQINPETWSFSFDRDAKGEKVLVLRKGEAEARYGRHER